jgi:dihydroorotate dehydrogenase
MISYNTLKPLLFTLDPENAHNIGEKFLHLASICPSLFNGWTHKNFVNDKRLHQKLFDSTFLNPIGLAAGFDKNATMVHAMMALGFGFTEVGTLTPKPQRGNDKPRLFRHIEEESIQNAFGFNNDGLRKIEKRLKKITPFTTPIGVNIGKNKLTPDERSIDDYITLTKALHTYANYMVVNISSPNTPGLRDLQNEKFITSLFGELTSITEKPILLKIAPDMEPSDAVNLTSLAVEAGAKGIIATNTTVDYSLVREPKAIGGLSGRVLEDKSFAIFEAVAKELYGKTTLIAVGGVANAFHAYKRLKAGASLVQVYSALIYHGPSLIGELNRGILELMERDGFTHISEVIGVDRQ